jgi:uncharacterized protein YciI
VSVAFAPDVSTISFSAAASVIGLAVENGVPEAVHTLVKEDPFWRTGLRQAVRILAWSQVFAEGKRLI